MGEAKDRKMSETLQLKHVINPQRVRDLELSLLRARGQEALAAVAARLWAALNPNGEP